MNKNSVNTTLANPSNPYMYHIQDDTFGYVAIMDEFHIRYVNAAPALVINIKTNQNVNNLPRFLFSIFCDTELSNVSGRIFSLKIKLLIFYRKWTSLSMNLFELRIKKFSSPKTRNRQFVFTLRIEYKLVAERDETNLTYLQFST